MMLVFPQGATPYLTDGADFDGSSDYMSRGAALTGISSTKTFTLSFWFYADSVTNVDHILSFVRTSPSLSDFLDLKWVNDSGNLYLDMQADSSTQPVLRITPIRPNAGGFSTGTWNHVLISVDLSNTSNRGLYVNDAAPAESVWNTYVNQNIEFGNMANGYVATTGISPGAQLFDGGLAELWFDTTYIDLSVEANRRKFIDADGKPVNLGDTGELPTGSAPLIYLRVEDGAAASTFATNLGTGGNFSITGSLGITSTSPSD